MVLSDIFKFVAVLVVIGVCAVGTVLLATKVSCELDVTKLEKQRALVEKLVLRDMKDKVFIYRIDTVAAMEKLIEMEEFNDKYCEKKYVYE